MAILATVAFGARVTPDDVLCEGIESMRPAHIDAARELDMAVRLIGTATLVDAGFDVRVQPALVDRHHPLAAVDGAFNAVMLQGDAIREITLEGPGAGGFETASAIVADMVSVVGTAGTGFLQNDACWRSLPRAPVGEPRPRGLAEVGGPEPDRFLQGPGNDGRGLQGTGRGGAGRDLRLDRQHGSLGGGVRRARGPTRARAPAGGRGRDREARPGESARRAAARGARLLRRSARRRTRARLARHPCARQLAQPAPHRGPEDRGARDPRTARRAAPRGRAPVRRRR